MAKTNLLSQEQVKHIAKLANLELTEQEVSLFQKQLSQILDYFELLKAVDTKNTEETSQVTGLKNVFREDVTLPSLAVEKALKNAKKQHNNYFQVPAVLNHE
ncbi:asparaginyl/glutamyl-tRNA amidotransferase subunit C [Candidatus Beckwithbacteria bacterium RBG_13_42_9]|uniref:Aspartyl/glutamyl-tRNA(Asn/Gln) amidotransferase subunit C n=1 Tax=Candidatus Beckwithbacteria bacterium RBG_13_42_9 TaxID=1797457 RepID=A0A1F5E5L5_9BACT|nr:MAG: asparaginyl/glutamyl-tRNA amidotransferase subunit C [Candidatus Beckwithbacteria bacterium RBG_13_42_9]